MLEFLAKVPDVGRTEELVEDFLQTDIHRPKRYITVARGCIRVGVSAAVVERVLQAGRRRAELLRAPDSVQARFDVIDAENRVRRGELASADSLLDKAARHLERDDRDLLLARASLAMRRDGGDDSLALEECIEHDFCEERMRAHFEAGKRAASSFGTWVAEIRTQARPKRKRIVLDGRSAAPRRLPEMTLQEVGGMQTLALPLEAGSSVIEVVSGSCNPCLRQAPRLEQLARELPRHTKLFVVAYDDAADTATKMREAGFSGPVFDGTQYSDAFGITGFPSALFVDSNGRIQYEVVGGSGHLVEEYIWRVEDIVQRGVHGR